MGEEKRLRQTAAVIGTAVPWPLLQAIAEVTEEVLHRRLAQLQAAEFLYEAGLYPEREYTFKHTLTHEVAYGSLLQERRRALHARIAVIQQQAGRIAALEARLSQNSGNSDRPPSSDPPYAKRPASSGIQGRPGAKPGHPGHRQALLAPPEVIAVKPESCPCGQTEFSDTAPYQSSPRHPAHRQFW